MKLTPVSFNEGVEILNNQARADKVLKFLSAHSVETQKVILELALADTKGRLARLSVEKFEQSGWPHRRLDRSNSLRSVWHKGNISIR